MKKTKIYDVIIVGAGPAGLSTALECAKRGLNILLIEESPLLQTEKSWLTFPDAVKRYPLLKKAITNRVHRLRLYNFNKGEAFDSDRTAKTGYIIEQALMNKAYKKEIKQHRKCKILDRTLYQKSYREDGLVKVKTSKGDFTGKIIADCSGSYSAVAEDLEVANEKFWLFMCYFLRIYKKDALSDYDSVVFSRGQPDFISIGTAGALYPNSKKYFDIGIAGYLRSNRDTGKIKAKLKRQMINLWNFFQKQGLIKKEVAIDFSKEFYGGIRVTPRRQIVDDNIVLVGDSAGQGSPISGEGLRTGLYYGEMAGRIIAEAIKKNDYTKKTLEKYSVLCQKKPLFGYRYGLLTQFLLRNNLILGYPFTKLHNLYHRNKRSRKILLNQGLKIMRNDPISFEEGFKILMKFYLPR